MNIRIFLFLLIGLLASSCNNSQHANESDAIATPDKIDNKMDDEVVGAKQIEINDDKDFIALFPDFETLPDEFLFADYQFDNSKKEQFWRFSSYLKEGILMDVSENEWFYLPVGKYKYNKTDYILFIAEEIDGKTTISVILWYLREDSDRRFSMGMPIYTKNEGNTIKAFEFLANKIDSVKVYTDKRKDHVDVYVLDRGEYTTRYYNMSKYLKLTATEKVREYEFSRFCNLFPRINNEWSSQKQINLLKNKPQQDEFSRFVYRRTKFGAGYVSDPYDFVVRYSPLGYKLLNDSLHLLVLLNHAPDYNQSDIKILIIRDLNTVIDEKNVTNSDIIKTEILYKEEILQLKSVSAGETFNKKFICTEEGFLFEPKSFETNYKKPLKFPYILDNGLLNHDNGYVGRLETSRFYLLMFYKGEEIASGFHAFSAYAHAELYNKVNLKLIGEVGLYDYFSDNGDENGAIIYADKIYSQDITDEKPLNKNPKEGDFQKLLTNYGFLNKEIVIKRKGSSVYANFQEFVSALPKLELPHKPVKIKVEDAANNKSESNQYFSNIIDSVKFANEAHEPYIPLHIPIGWVGINQKGLLMIWQTFGKSNNENQIGEFIPYLEICIYNEEAEEFSKIERLPFDTKITQEIVNQLFKIE